MSSPRVRPTFEQRLEGGAETFWATLQASLAEDGAPCEGTVFEDGAMLRMRTDPRPVWSPTLHLFLERDEGGERIRGTFSPSSPVWTAFLAIYIGLGCVATATGCWGWAQWTVDETPWALIGVPVSAVLAGLTYGAAFIGQGLGAEDMHVLRSFVERSSSPPRTAPSRG